MISFKKMSAIWAIALFVVLAGVPAGAQAPEWHWKKLGKGVEYCAEQTELFGRVEYITAVRYKMFRHKTRLLHAPGSDADSTSALAGKMGAVAAINGSYFNVKTLEPVTYLRLPNNSAVGHTTPRESRLRTDGVLAIDSRGGIHMFPCDSLQSEFLFEFPAVIAAGPVLLQDGKPARDSWPGDGFYTKHHPRSLIGKDKKNRAYLIVIDGRFPGQGDGASIDETVQIAQMFGLFEALNLDGGGSCALWTPQTGVLSHPYDNRKFDHYGQRIVPNIVYIR